MTQSRWQKSSLKHIVACNIHYETLAYPRHWCGI